MSVIVTLLCINQYFFHFVYFLVFFDLQFSQRILINLKALQRVSAKHLLRNFEKQSLFIISRKWQQNSMLFLPLIFKMCKHQSILEFWSGFSDPSNLCLYPSNQLYVLCMSLMANIYQVYIHRLCWLFILFKTISC